MSLYIVVSVPPLISQSENSDIPHGEVFSMRSLSGPLIRLNLKSTTPKMCAEDLLFWFSDGEKDLEGVIEATDQPMLPIRSFG